VTANRWLQEGPTLVVAHRGANAYAPENTLASFRLAAEQGADAIEFDVRATADQHLVVIHDASLARTTNRDGEIASLPLEEVRRADAGGRHRSGFRGERVPTLAEVLETARGRLLVDIELKVSGVEAHVAEHLARAGMTSDALVTSFLEDAVSAMRALAAGVAVGLLQQWPDLSRATDLGMDVYLPHVRSLSAELVAVCRAHGLHIIPWTVRSEDEARFALQHGVRALIADDPLLARRMIESG